MNIEELEKNVESKINSIMSEEYEKSPKNYYWDNPNWNIYKDKLIERLKIDNPNWVLEGYEKIAEGALHAISPMLEKNLVEYINGEPLTDIEIGTEKFSVNKIMRLNNNGDVIGALKDLSIYSIDEREGRVRIMSGYR